MTKKNNKSIGVILFFIGLVLLVSPVLGIFDQLASIGDERQLFPCDSLTEVGAGSGTWSNLNPSTYIDTANKAEGTGSIRMVEESGQCFATHALLNWGQDLTYETTMRLSIYYDADWSLQTFRLYLYEYVSSEGVGWYYDLPMTPPSAVYGWHDIDVDLTAPSSGGQGSGGTTFTEPTLTSASLCTVYYITSSGANPTVNIDDIRVVWTSSSSPTPTPTPTATPAPSSSPTPTPTATPSPTPPPTPPPSTSGEVNLVIGSAVGGVTEPLAGTYTYNATDSTSVNIIAIPTQDFVFDYWLFSDGSTATDNPHTLSMSQSYSVIPVFSLIQSSQTTTISWPLLIQISGALCMVAGFLVYRRK